MNKQLARKIKRLRQQLIQLVDRKGSFLDEEVVELSQRLDQYILIAQKSALGLKVCG